MKFVSEPKNDTVKTIVGVACAARAITEGHEVSVFFAAAGTRLLDPGYIEELNEEMEAVWTKREDEFERRRVKMMNLIGKEWKHKFPKLEAEQKLLREDQRHFKKEKSEER